MELEMEMEYLLDLSKSEEIEEKEELEEFATLEIDPGLLLRNGHLSWLFHLVYPISMNSADQALHFCINCSRYLALHEQATSHSYQHQLAQGSCPHRLYPMIVVQCRDNELGEVDYSVSVQALRDIQVPIGDVISHVLHHPHPWLIRMSGAENDLARCLYLHPRSSRYEIWQGEILSGRCAYRDCEKVFNNRQSHLRLYGITPQFCSVSCKIKSWLCCHTSCNN